MADSSESSPSSTSSSDEGSSGWPGLFAYLNKTFDLLRDIFGYALPGLVFFAICVAAAHPTLTLVHEKLKPYEPNTWAQGLLAAAGCYAMGHILIMLAYLPIDLFKLALFLLAFGARFIDNFRRWLERRADRKAEENKAEDNKKEGKQPKDRGRIYRLLSRLDWSIAAKFCDDVMATVPTEVPPDIIRIRRSHPEFFPVWDRRETMAMAIGGLAMALLLGGIYNCYYVHRFWGHIYHTWLLPALGLILWFDFFTAMLHLVRLRAAIIKADALTGTELATGEYERAILELVKKCACPENKPGSDAARHHHNADDSGSAQVGR